MDLLLDNAYLLLGLGALLEGEVSVLVGGVLAKNEALALPAVIAIASAMAWLNDLSCFWMGRCQGGSLLGRRPSLQRRLGAIHAMVERHPRASVFLVRFTYGLRMAGPMLIGTSGVCAWRFALMSALSCLAWGAAVSCLGWGFGSAAQAAWASHGWKALLALPLSAALVVGVTWVIKRQSTSSARRLAQPPPRR